MDGIHLPGGAGVDRQTFLGAQPSGGTQWTTWYKPRGRSMLSILNVGSGAGGGGAAGNTAGSARGGGGGGGGAACVRFVVPLVMIPDELYIQVFAGGLGGAGGSSGNGSAGNPGLLSTVAIYPNAGTPFHILSVNGTAPTGGGAGTSATGGANGSSGSTVTATAMILAALGVFASQAGMSGSSGGAQTGAIGSPLGPSGSPFFAGTGGAGSQSADFVGGVYSQILASSPFQATTAAPAGANGSDGFRFGQYPIFYGGSGGGASNSVAGGRGGSGMVPGTGGGGGGAGVTTGGRGGDGGPGLVEMICW